MTTTMRSAVITLAVALAWVGPTRADYFDTTTETLDDGWTRYTYTLQRTDSKLLRSFSLEGDAFEGARNLTQPIDFIGYANELGLSWARDAHHLSRRHVGCPDRFVFSFESLYRPGEVGFTLNYTCVLVTNKTVGPTRGDGGGVTGVKTPEPSSLCLLAVGGLVCAWRRRRGNARSDRDV